MLLVNVKNRNEMQFPVGLRFLLKRPAPSVTKAWLNIGTHMLLFSGGRFLLDTE